MNYAKIRNNDIANGPGVRVTLFVSGCTIICPGCQNYEIQNFRSGQPFTHKEMDEIIKLAAPDHIDGLTLLGGEPLAPPNIETTLDIIRTFRLVYGNTKTVWLWSGFQLNFDLDGSPHYYRGNRFQDKPQFFHRELLSLIDVLVDGRWEQDNYDPKLLWAGSTNQRVIDVAATLKENEIVLYSDNYNI